MANYLNYTCPKCGGGENISVAVVVGAKLLPAGHVIENVGELDIWECSGATCHICGYEGEAKEFMPLTGATHAH
jgi:hypothetical protein